MLAPVPTQVATQEELLQTLTKP